MSTPYETGPKTARIAVIAEAPGVREVEKREPLIGPSGSILEQCLSSAGISRGSLYIGNVCRHQIRDASALLTKHGSWTDDGYTEYEAFCERVRMVEANVFVALGNIAFFALTGKTGIAKHRGSMYPCTVPGLEDRKVIATYHPAAVLRGMSTWLYFISWDLIRVKGQANDRSFPQPHGELITRPRLQDCHDYLALCRDRGKFAHDIEVYGKHISCMSFSVGFESAISIPFYDGESRNKSMWSSGDERLLWDDICATLMGGHEIVGQNYIFDMGVLLFRNRILPLGTIQDTMIAHSILYPDLPKGLDTLASLYTWIPYYKDEGKLWNKLDDAQDKFWEYSAKDAVATMLCWEAIQPELEKHGDMQTYRNTIDLYYPFLGMQQQGIRIDMDELAEYKKQIEAQLDAAEKELEQTAEIPFSYRSPKQCAEYFYEHLGHKPYLHRKTGSQTTDDTAMSRLYIQHGVKEAKLVGNCRRLYKLLNTSLEMEIDDDKRMRCSINPRGTKFGRVSTGKTIFGTGGNMQNIDPRFKRLLTPDPGKLFLEIDLAGAEWIVVAYYAQDKDMMEVCQGTESPHLITAHRMSGVPKDLILLEDEAVGHLTDPADIKTVREEATPQLFDWQNKGTFLPSNMSLRQAAKRANHGLNYGLGYRTFSVLYNMPERDAKRICELYLRSYPGVERMHKYIRDTLQNSRRTLVNCFGRQQRFHTRWGDELFRSAYAFPAQSTVVDIVNQGIRKIWDDPQLVDWQMLMQVHDSILFQVDDPGDDAAMARLCEQVRIATQHLSPQFEYHKRTFTIPVELKASRSSWGDMTLKWEEWYEEKTA